jgi:hypothetical protein
VILITTSITAENYIVPYNSTVTADIILQGLPTYNRDFQIFDLDTGRFSSIEGQTFVDIDGYSKATVQYNSFKCSNTGLHRAVLELEDYSQFQYEVPLFISGKSMTKIFSNFNIPEILIGNCR